MARGLWAALAAVVALAAVALAAAHAALANPGDTLLVSVPAEGGLGNNDSLDQAVSADTCHPIVHTRRIGGYQRVDPR